MLIVYTLFANLHTLQVASAFRLCEFGSLRHKTTQTTAAGFQVKIWFQNRRSKYKKMLKAQQQQPAGSQANNAQSGGQGGSGPAGSTPLHPPASATTPQTPPETPENHTPPSVGPPPLLPVGSMPSTPASSASMSTISPPAMSPPISSWDMGPAKAAAMSNSYIPQYSWYHHGHDPSINSQLLT
ncbi:distal-less-like protein [Leptotrombidium deliense]|uniref:Distal-less-like protein n=1 Tax=Leptotrombidium deliense TaxID=299467 RepID=A0A443SUJ5_9ACAR|nr:distal-less-like protein [Leptotrombidium deliense]